MLFLENGIKYKHFFVDIRILCVIFYYFVTFKVSDKISDYGQVEIFKGYFIILNRQCYRSLCVDVMMLASLFCYLFIYIYN